MRYTKERAAKALPASGEKIFDLTRQYIEAIRDGELPRYYMQRLATYKLYSDALPDHRLVDVWHPDYPSMKCGSQAVYGICARLRGSIEDDVIADTGLKDAIGEFVAYRWNCFRGGKGEFWTTSEEIQKINNMLDTALEYLQQKYGIQPDWDAAEREIKEFREHEHRGFPSRK